MARIIDADEFMKNFDKEIENGATDVFDAVENALEETPAIEAGPVKHGKWKYDEDVKALYCGCCGIFAQPQRKTNYCPHCGADMRGE